MATNSATWSPPLDGFSLPTTLRSPGEVGHSQYDGVHSWSRCFETCSVWLRRLFADLGYAQTKPTMKFEDNEACEKLIKNYCGHDRIKHLDIRSSMVREHLVHHSGPCSGSWSACWPVHEGQTHSSDKTPCGLGFEGESAGGLPDTRYFSAWISGVANTTRFRKTTRSLQPEHSTMPVGFNNCVFRVAPVVSPLGCFPMTLAKATRLHSCSVLQCVQRPTWKTWRAYSNKHAAVEHIGCFVLIFFVENKKNKT